MAVLCPGLPLDFDWALLGLRGDLGFELAQGVTHAMLPLLLLLLQVGPLTLA